MLPNRFLLQTEPVVLTRSVKKVLLNILQNSQENTCARVYFLMKLQRPFSPDDCFMADVFLIYKFIYWTKFINLLDSSYDSG